MIFDRCWASWECLRALQGPNIHPKTLQNRGQDGQKRSSNGRSYSECVESRAVLAGPVRLLSKSWAGPGLLLGILVGFREALGLSWAAPGLLLGRLGHSWAVLGGSWTFLGGSWVVLGCSWAILDGSWALLGGSWSDLGRQVGAKMDPKRHKVDPKTFQNRGEDRTKRC